MPVGSKEFQRWADEHLEGHPWGEVAKLSGLKRTTLHQQLVRGRVAEATVVAVARGFDLPVVDVLGHFEPYKDVHHRLGEATSDELLSQISYIDVLKMILHRSGDCERPRESELVAFPFKDSVRAWVDAIDTGKLRQTVADAWGIAAGNLSTQLKTGLPPGLAVSIARHAHVAPANGLVVIGLLTPGEGSWPPGIRLDVLESLSDRELISAAVQKLNVLNRAGGRKDAGEGDLNQFWEYLG